MTTLKITTINNEEKRIKLGVSGFNRVNSELNSKIMVRKTLKIYETVIHDYNARKIKRKRK